MTECVPEELLATMPPMVARLAVEMSGANCRPCGLTCWLRSSSTQPGSTRTQRSAALISRTRLKYLEQSRMTPGPIDCPACEVPPPRAVSGTPKRAQTRHGGDDVVRRPGQDDAERHDLVDAGIGGVQRAVEPVEADLAGDRADEGIAQAGDIDGQRLRDLRQRCEAHRCAFPRHGPPSVAARRAGVPVRAPASRRRPRTRRATCLRRPP